MDLWAYGFIRIFNFWKNGFLPLSSGNTAWIKHSNPYSHSHSDSHLNSYSHSHSDLPLNSYQYLNSLTLAIIFAFISYSHTDSPWNSLSYWIHILIHLNLKFYLNRYKVWQLRIWKIFFTGDVATLQAGKHVEIYVYTFRYNAMMLSSEPCILSASNTSSITTSKVENYKLYFTTSSLDHFQQPNRQQMISQVFPFRFANENNTIWWTNSGWGQTLQCIPMC